MDERLMALRCPGCDRTWECHVEMAGESALCPHCDHPFTVPPPRRLRCCECGMRWAAALNPGVGGEVVCPHCAALYRIAPAGVATRRQSVPRRRIRVPAPAPVRAPSAALEFTRPPAGRLEIPLLLLFLATVAGTYVVDRWPAHSYRTLDLLIAGAPLAPCRLPSRPQSRRRAEAVQSPVRPGRTKVEKASSQVRKQPGMQELRALAVSLRSGTYTRHDGVTMGYRYFVPENAATDAPVPLVLFLHGIGERGTDNKRQLRHPEPLMCLSSDSQARYPCFLVAPQHGQREQWAGGGFDEPSAALRGAVEIVDLLIGRFPAIDRERLYVTGLSSGGAGALDCVCKYPYKFAGVVPVSAGWDPAMFVHPQRLAAWGFYNQREAASNRAGCDAMLETVAKYGGAARRTVYPGGGHNAWSKAYREAELIPWLFAHRRQPAGACREELTFAGNVPQPGHLQRPCGRSPADATVSN